MGLCGNFALTPFTQYHLVDSLYFLPCNSWNVRSENLVLDQFFSLVDIFLFFFSFPCLVDCKEKFCLGHSWELSNY